jgi:hypothetical protein
MWPVTSRAQTFWMMMLVTVPAGLVDDAAGVRGNHLVVPADDVGVDRSGNRDTAGVQRGQESRAGPVLRQAAQPIAVSG